MPRLLPCLLAAALLAACTVRVPYPLGIQRRAHVAVAVAPSTFSAPVHRLSDIGEGGKGARLGDALAAVGRGVDASVAGWLRQRPGVSLLKDRVPVRTALAEAKRRGADLLLAVDVSGYGHIKRRWVVLLFGSGVIEGITQGVVATDATGNAAIGIGVGAEEMASEGLTWIGGSWFWDRYFAPVTLVGDMWRVRDGKLVWRDVVFADNSDQEIWGLLTGKRLPDKRHALAASLGKAEQRLLRHLGRYMRDEVLRRRSRAGGEFLHSGPARTMLIPERDATGE